MGLLTLIFLFAILHILIYFPPQLCPFCTLQIFLLNRSKSQKYFLLFYICFQMLSGNTPPKLSLKHIFAFFYVCLVISAKYISSKFTATAFFCKWSGRHTLPFCCIRIIPDGKVVRYNLEL